MKKLVGLLVWLCPVWCFAQVPDTLFVSCSQTVHLRFASELKYVGLGDRVLLAKIVDGSKDFVAVKAREAFEGCTSLSCLEASGAMHSFVVAYREHPTRLDIDTRLPEPQPKSSFSSQSKDTQEPSDDFKNIVRMKQELYHLGTREHGIEIRCENIFVKEDVLYLLVSLQNWSAMSYEPSTPRFAIESRRRTRRGLEYEKGVFPRQVYGLGSVPPGDKGRFVFTFDKLSLIRNQVLRVYFYEKNGSRNLVMTIGMDDISNAKKM